MADFQVIPSWNVDGTGKADGSVTFTIDGQPQPVTSGIPVTIPATATTASVIVHADYQINKIFVDGVDTPPTSSTAYTYTVIVADVQPGSMHTFAVVFDHQIKATANGSGCINSGGSPVACNSSSNNVIVSNGSTKTFDLVATSGSCVTDVKVDGTSIGAFASSNDNYTGNSYTFSNVSASHSLEAAFGTATIKILIGANDGTENSANDLYLQARSVWRAYKTDSSGNKTGAAFKTGKHGDTIAIPADLGSCDTSAIIIEFLNIDGWKTPTDSTVDLQTAFKDQQINGLYDANSHVLTTNATNGTISRDPLGDPWVTDNQRVYPQGTTVTLGARPNTGWYFSRWDGDIGTAAATNSSIALTMDQDRSVTAVFVQPCQDADKDGYTVGAYGTSCQPSTLIDCDDTNPDIHPGAPEICGDGIDQNCNGTADDACTGDDKDNDGDGYSKKDGDCDDTNANIAPGKYDDPTTTANEDCYDDVKQAGTERVCVTTSDTPANVAMKPAPPMIMFLLDDSGSMDWEVMTSEDDQRFNGDGYIFPCDELEKTYAQDTYPALSSSERGLWQSQWTGYNRMYFNPAATYTPWPYWQQFAENTRTHERAYTPNATSATFPATAYAAGYTHADMDFPRLNSYDQDSVKSAMYHPGDTATDRSKYQMDLNGTFMTVINGGQQQVKLTRESANSWSYNRFGYVYNYTTTFADAIGLNATVLTGTTQPAYIFDNADSGIFATVGSWATDGSGLYTDTTGSTATWNINLTTAGDYYVYAKVNQAQTRDYSARYDINYDNNGVLAAAGPYYRDQSSVTGWLLLNTTTLHFKAQSASTTVTIPNAHYYVLLDTNGNGKKDTGESLYLVTIPGSGYQVGNYSLHYYLVNDANNNNSVDNGELIEKSASEVPSAVIPVRYDAFGTRITQADQLAYMVRQDFADWVSFYRKRILTAKAAVSLTIEDMKGVELGVYTINHSLYKPVVLMNTADGTEKQTYLKNLYNIRAIGSTYLRGALYEVGKYFQKGADSGTYGTYSDRSGSHNSSYYLSTTDGLGSSTTCATTTDTSVFWDDTSKNTATNCNYLGGECQRSYVVVMTDGYYNDLYFSYYKDSSNNYLIGNVDGNSAYKYTWSGKSIDSVFQDSASSTLADIAMYYYLTDLDPDLSNSLPRKGFDDNPQQHVVTYAVAFGVAGAYNPNLFPNCLPKCDTPGSQGCPLISDLTNLAKSSYSSTGGPYKNSCPSWWTDNDLDINNSNATNMEYRVDDLYHAAVNSRGAFINATDPAELVNAMKTIKDLIETQTGTAASVAINAKKVTENTLLYQSTYDTSDWSGDVMAKCLDTSGAIASCNKTDCQAACSSTYTSCIAGCSGTASCEESCVTNKTSCTAACTGSTCDETYNTCTAGCSTSSCQTACSSARNSCLLNAPEVKWSASTKLATVPATNRQIITADNLGSGLPFRWANINALMQSQLGGDQDLLNYLRGDSTYERKNNPSGTKIFRNRSSKLGDFINSEPYHYSNTTLGVDWVIIGGNDGMLHIFDSTTGAEVFAFIPNTVFANLPLLAKENYTSTHKFFVDGSVTVKNIASTPSGKVILVGGLGKGGKGYFALDLTAAATNKTAIEGHASEIVLWEYSDSSLATYVTSAAHSALGYSFSQPQIIASNDSTASWFVAFGNGYESASGHAALFALGLNSSGKIAWSKIIDTGVGGTNTSTCTSTTCTLTDTCNGLSTPAFIFPQGDTVNDFAYAGDLLGNLWKFDFSSLNKDNWTIYFQNSTGVKQPLFQAKSAAGWRQPITIQPTIISACPSGEKGYQILFGTGRILDPTKDFPDLSVQTVYGIWDWSAAWKAAGSSTPEQKFLGSFGTTSSATTACKSSCSSVLGTATTNGSCLFSCNGDSDCISDCNDDYTTCTTNCSALRGLSNMSTIVGATVSPYVTLLRQTQVYAAGINYNSDGTIAETVYGATDVDAYDVISRDVSSNPIDWYIPAEATAFSLSTQKTAKHVGWYFDLPANGERIVRDMTVTNGTLVFTSTVPSGSPCKSGGTSHIWAVNACTGGLLENAFFDVNNDGVIDQKDYINIGTAAHPHYVPVSSIGLKGITPGGTLADIPGSNNGMIYQPEQDKLKAIPVDTGKPISYWLEMKWQQ